MRSTTLVPAVAALALAIAGCTSSPPATPKWPPIRVVQGQPFAMNVARVEVRAEYQPPGGPTHVEGEIPISPEQAIQQWAQDRMQPIGSANIIRVVINDAEATETPLPVQNGLQSAFTTQQAARIDIKVNITVEVLDEQQLPISSVTGTAERSRTIPQGLTLNQHDQIDYDMLTQVMTDLNAQVSPEMQNTFGRWMQVP